MDTVIEPLLVLDANLRIVAANQPFLSTFKLTSEEVLGHSFYRLGGGAWNIPELRQQIDATLTSSHSMRGLFWNGSSNRSVPG